MIFLVTDATNCQATAQVTITDEPGPIIDNVLSDNSICSDANGTLTIQVSLGTAPLEYSIDNGSTFEPTGIFPNLLAGSYDIVVVDANGCMDTATATVVDEPGPNIVDVNYVDPSCGLPNGTIEILAVGFTPPLEYSIDGGLNFQASNTFANLPPTTYPIVVQDGNGCQATDQVVLTDQPGPVIDDIDATNSTCGIPNGEIIITISDGTAPIGYSIDNGGAFQSSNTFTGLTGGTYDIVVQDVNGCEATSTVVLLDLPSPVIDSVVVDDPTCGLDEGVITIYTSSGTVPLEFSINGGGSFQGGNVFTGLAPGNYDIVVQDVKRLYRCYYC